MTTLTNVQLHSMEKLPSFSEKDIDALIEQVLAAQKQVNDEHQDLTAELRACGGSSTPSTGSTMRAIRRCFPKWLKASRNWWVTSRGWSISTTGTWPKGWTV